MRELTLSARRSRYAAKRSLSRYLHQVSKFCPIQQQKTMCKHLMEAPYLYQVVDDPNLAAMVSFLGPVSCFSAKLITLIACDQQSKGQ